MSEEQKCQSWDISLTVLGCSKKSSGHAFKARVCQRKASPCCSRGGRVQCTCHMLRRSLFKICVSHRIASHRFSANILWTVSRASPRSPVELAFGYYQHFVNCGRLWTTRNRTHRYCSSGCEGSKMGHLKFFLLRVTQGDH